MNRAKLPAIFVFLATLAMEAGGAAFQGSVKVELVEVKNVGVSASNESNSIIQVRWNAATQPSTVIKSFDLSLEVVYADGAAEKAKASVDGKARNARFEIPTLHRAAGRNASEMKSFKINITATVLETFTKQGNF
ncbi:MAG: hypothetical protein AB1631_16960 [Acidobacteriota bacterium]